MSSNVHEAASSILGFAAWRGVAGGAVKAYLGFAISQLDVPSDHFIHRPSLGERSWHCDVMRMTPSCFAAPSPAYGRRILAAVKPAAPSGAPRRCWAEARIGQRWGFALENWLFSGIVSTPHITAASCAKLPGGLDDGGRRCCLCRAG